ncbi:MAG: hypothetical protein KatS3mg002_0824 [Candidatus Woesearchaeota archaeon]|nr:MAG: hypothetical protein KatS3mg002_0824 [Candidatus Woesearchaeota archaeon]
MRPQAIITLGYSDDVPEERSLLPIENITFFNRYGMKIEKLHIVLRDYSVEWERQGNMLKSKLKKASNKIKEGINKIIKKK